MTMPAQISFGFFATLLRKKLERLQIGLLLEISLCFFLIEIRCTIWSSASSEKHHQKWLHLQTKFCGKLSTRELSRSRSDFLLLFWEKNWSVCKLKKNVAISIKKNSTTKSASVRHPRACPQCCFVAGLNDHWRNPPHSKRKWSHNDRNFEVAQRNLRQVALEKTALDELSCELPHALSWLWVVWDKRAEWRLPVTSIP